MGILPSGPHNSIPTTPGVPPKFNRANIGSITFHNTILIELGLEFQDKLNDVLVTQG